MASVHTTHGRKSAILYLQFDSHHFWKCQNLAFGTKLPLFWDLYWCTFEVPTMYLYLAINYSFKQTFFVEKECTKDPPSSNISVHYLLWQAWASPLIVVSSAIDTRLRHSNWLTASQGQVSSNKQWPQTECYLFQLASVRHSVYTWYLMGVIPIAKRIPESSTRHQRYIFC